MRFRPAARDASMQPVQDADFSHGRVRFSTPPSCRYGSRPSISSVELSRRRGGLRWMTPISAANGAAARRARYHSWRRSRASASARSSGVRRWPAPGSRIVTDSFGRLNVFAEAGHPHGIETQCRAHGALQMSERDAGQRQECNRRHVTQARFRSCRMLSRQLRLALQSALPTQDHDPALLPYRRTHPTSALIVE